MTDTIESPKHECVLQPPEYLKVSPNEINAEFEKSQRRMYVLEAYLWHIFLIGFYVISQAGQKLQPLWPRPLLLGFMTLIFLTYSELLAGDLTERVFGPKLSAAFVRISTYCLAVLPIGCIVLLYRWIKLWGLLIGFALFMCLIMAPSLLFWKPK